MAFFPSNNDVDMMAMERRMDDDPDAAKAGVWKKGPSSSLGDPDPSTGCPFVAPPIFASRCPSRLPTSSSSSPSSSSPSCSRRSSTGSDDSGGGDEPSPPPRNKPAHRVNVKLKPKFRPQFPFLQGQRGQHGGIEQDDGTAAAPSVPSLSLDGGGGVPPPRLAPASLLFPSPPTAPRPDAAAGATIPLRDGGGDLMEARGRLFGDADDVLRNLSSMGTPGVRHAVRPDASEGTDGADPNGGGQPSLAGDDDAARRKSSCRGFGSLLRGASTSSDETWNLDDCVEETDEAFAMAIEDLRQHNGGGGGGGGGDADPAGGHIAFPALSSPPPTGGAVNGGGVVVIPPALAPEGDVFTPSPSSARTPEHSGRGRPPPPVVPPRGLNPRHPIPPRFPVPRAPEEEKDGGPPPPDDLRAMPFLDALADGRTPSPPPRPGRPPQFRRQSSASSAMSIEEVSAAIEAAARVIGATGSGRTSEGRPPPANLREIEPERGDSLDGTTKLSCREKRRAFAFAKSSTSQQAMEDVISKAFEHDYECPQGVADPSTLGPSGSGSFNVRPLRQALERSISNLSDHRFTIDEDEEVVAHGHDHYAARHSCPCGPMPPTKVVRERNLSHPKQLLERSISTLSESNFRTPVQSDSSTSASAAEAKYDEKMDDCDHEDPFAPSMRDDEDEEKAEGDAIMARRRGSGGSSRISWGSVSSRSSASSGNGPRSVWKNNSLLRTSSKTFARIEEQVADQRRQQQQGTAWSHQQQHPPPPVHPQSQTRRDVLPPPAAQPLPPCLFLESATSVVEAVAAEAMAPPPPRLLRPPVRVQRNTSHPRHLLERSISNLSESNFRTPVHDGGLGDARGAAAADEKVNDEEEDHRDPFAPMGAEEEARLHEEAEAVRRRSSASSVNGPRSVWKNNSLLRTSSKTFVRFEEDFRRQEEEESRQHQVQVQLQLPPALLAPPRRALMRSISNLSERNFHTPGGEAVGGGDCDAAFLDQCPPPPQRRLPDEAAGEGDERGPPSRNDSLLMLPRLSGLSGSSGSFFGGGAPGEATFGGGEGGGSSGWSDDASATDFLRVPC